jgi:hypothetical protein
MHLCLDGLSSATMIGLAFFHYWQPLKSALASGGGPNET